MRQGHARVRQAAAPGDSVQHVRGAGAGCVRGRREHAHGALAAAAAAVAGRARHSGAAPWHQLLQLRSLVRARRPALSLGRRRGSLAAPNQTARLCRRRPSLAPGEHRLLQRFQAHQPRVQPAPQRGRNASPLLHHPRPTACAPSPRSATQRRRARGGRVTGEGKTRGATTRGRRFDRSNRASQLSEAASCRGPPNLALNIGQIARDNHHRQLLLSPPHTQHQLLPHARRLQRVA